MVGGAAAGPLDDGGAVGGGGAGVVQALAAVPVDHRVGVDVSGDRLEVVHLLVAAPAVVLLVLRAVGLAEVCVVQALPAVLADGDRGDGGVGRREQGDGAAVLGVCVGGGHRSGIVGDRQGRVGNGRRAGHGGAAVVRDALDDGADPAPFSTKEVVLRLVRLTVTLPLLPIRILVFLAVLSLGAGGTQLNGGGYATSLAG